MGRFLRYLVAACLCSVSSHAFAEAYWTDANYTSDTTHYTSYSAAFAGALSRNCGGSGTLTGSPVPNTSGYTQGMSCGGQANATLNCTSPNSKINGTPPSCSCPSGTSWNGNVCYVAVCNVPSGTVKRFNGTGATPPVTFCASDDCVYNVQGIAVGFGTGAVWSGTYGSTSAACAHATGALTPKSDDSTCVGGTAGGNTACIQKKGCGTVNGTPVCVGTLNSDTCVTTSSGMTVCGKTAAAVTSLTAVATPPAPNTGVAGTPATPAVTITTEGSGNASGGATGPSQTSVFTAAQTAASTVASPGGVVTNNSGTGAPGTADHVIVDSGGGSGGGSSDCSSAGNCTSASGTFDTTVPSDVKDFGLALTDFYSAVGASPIGSAFSSVASAIPIGGTAPSASIVLFDHTYTLSVPTDLLSSISGLLSLVMKAVWSLIAIKRFMQA